MPVVPLAWGYQLVRWFHGKAEHTLVSSKSLLDELQGKRVGRQLVHWPRGVDAEVFHPGHRRGDVYAGLPGPIWLYVGRVAVEKSLEDFLKLPLPGTKVVVGDGPSREELQRKYPDVVWRGYQFGDDLAAHFASADCFVFPSRTETFGNVILEALASGLPVASVPAPGPVDLIVEGVNGAIDDDLHAACRRAIRCSRERARASIVRRTLRAGHDVFRAHLVPLRPEIASALRRFRARPRRGLRAAAGLSPDGSRSSGWPIWIDGPLLDAVARARSRRGANTTIVEPSSNQPISSPLRKAASHCDDARPLYSRCSEHVEEVQPDAGDQDRRHRHQRDEVPPRRAACG